MTEIKQHQLDELSVTDILSYLGARVSSVEEDTRRNRKQLTKAKELLNEFMRISKASDEDFEHDYSELIGATEQFIKGDGCPDCFCEDCTKEECGIKKLGLVEK